MGAQLVGLVFVFGDSTALKPNEFRLLAWMAHTALDTDERPRYFGSRELSAYGLGRDPDHDPEGSYYALKRAIKGLVDCHAIVRLRSGREGRSAEFAIVLGGLITGWISHPAQGEESTLEGSGNSPDQGEKSTTQGTTGRTRTRRGTTSRPRAPHFDPVENGTAHAH